MLDNCDIKARWSGVDELLERWLKERQSLIVQFCALSGVHEFAPQNSSNRNRLQKFCQLLPDYASTGHFEVYYELIREAEAFQDGSSELAKELLPAIAATTEAALDFSDKYTVAAPTEHGLLAKDLSRLGEVLAARFDYEDQLIAAMHAAHREQVA
jgi:regulator of sigma D